MTSPAATPYPTSDAAYSTAASPSPLLQAALAKLAATDTVVLSRFAYLRRRGTDMVLESPRSAALFRIADPHVAATIAVLSTPLHGSAPERPATSC